MCSPSMQFHRRFLSIILLVLAMPGWSACNRTKVRSAKVGALSNIHMASAEDPKAESQIVFPAGVSEVRCAFELDKNELNAGDSYSLNVVNSAGAVVAKADLIGVGAQDRAAVRFFGGTHFRPMMGQPSDISDATLFDVNVPVKAEGGTLLKGDYLSNITFNGKMKGSIDWSVAP